MKYLLGLILGLFFFQASAAPSHDALNLYVDFVNKSVHGMFMVNRLLVEYNLELNKYVDLESEKINNYSNKDLPQDIFEDPDHWFYDVSPYELALRAKKAGSLALTPEENKLLSMYTDRMIALIKASNKLRFDMDKVTIGIDLTKRDNIAKVYQKLEEGVKLFEDFYTVQQDMEKILDATRDRYKAENAAFSPLYQQMVKVQKTTRAVLNRIRNKNAEHLQQLLTAQELEIARLSKMRVDNLSAQKSTQAQINTHFENAIHSANKLCLSARAFQQHESIPQKYHLYGRFYFYYNVELLDKNNYYGTGVISELNNIIQAASLPVIKLTEMPHIFQIIYPRKIDNLEVIRSSDPFVEFLPDSIKSRIIMKEKSIRIDEEVATIELFDHMVVDGDIVSINYNGDWILEKVELERGSKKFKLQLNKEGRNFLLLHADNVGKRPPNTIGIRYTYRGEDKEVILKSDYNTSELIELKWVSKL